MNNPNPKPRILRIINRFNLGGPTYNAVYLTRYLSPDFETLLIGGDKEPAEESSLFIAENNGLQPTIIPFLKRPISPENDWKAYQQIRKIIRDFQPDIVHTHAAKAGLIGRLAAKHEGVQHIVHTYHGHVLHSYFNPLKTQFFKQLENYCASISSKIVVLSEEQKQELAYRFKIGKPNQYEIIPLGFDLQRFTENRTENRNSFRAKFKIANNEIAIGIIGRLTAIKNQQLFIETAEKLFQKTNKKLKFFIIGDGEDYQKLIEICKTKGLKYAELEHNVADYQIKFCSWIKNIEWALAGLDIVSLCSLNEGTPVSLIEAQAAGKPIVSSRVGGIESVVLENQTARLFSLQQPAMFVDALLHFIENETERHRYSAIGEAHVFRKYHYTRLVDDMKQLYQSLLRKKY
jgi:glycosyltransferase involved in cell wall biosynthesis